MVYIEQVIFDNLIVNSILIYLTLLIVKAKRNRQRIFSSAIIGTLFAVLLPFVDKFLMVYKLIALFSTTAFAIKYIDFKNYLFTNLIFAMLSFLLGGIVYGLFNFVTVGHNNMIVYPADSVIRYILLGIILIFYIGRQIKHFYARSVTSIENETSAEIVINDDICTLGCYMDTGNQLYDDLTLKPVVVLSNDIGARYLKGNERTLTVKTITSTKELPVITIQQLKIHSKSGDKTLDKIPAVVSDSTYNKYKLILNCELNGGGYDKI